MRTGAAGGGEGVGGQLDMPHTNFFSAKKALSYFCPYPLKDVLWPVVR